MKKILLLFCMASLVYVAAAQRVGIVENNGSNYFVIHAYGMPRDMVKTNAQMEASVLDDGGIMRRHITYKAANKPIGDDGYNCNETLSFAFLVAPYNVNIRGEHVYDADSWENNLTWTQASGWSSEIDDEFPQITADTVGIGSSIKAETPTGCAAYTGLKGEDEPGEWRLPTQREGMMLVAIIEQALTLSGAEDVENDIADGTFWCSTELYPVGNVWEAWTITTSTGITTHVSRDATIYNRARCVKDIFEDVNN